MTRKNYAHTCGGDEPCHYFNGEGCILHGKDRSDHYDLYGSIPPCKRVASLSMSIPEELK